MEFTMQWFKVLFTEGDPRFLESLYLACQKIGQLKDFAIYSGAEFTNDDRIGYDVIYFSPSAALICGNLLATPFQFVACEPPDPNTEFVRFWCGVRSLLRPLRRRES